MRIAVIGSGISGLTAAYLLQRSHEVTLFEADGRLGGHTSTVDVEAGGLSWAVDTGFIVFNETTYPNFVALLRKIGVAWQKSEMSFSVQCAASGLEYRPSTPGTLFAQRRNLWSVPFWRMLVDIFRLQRSAGDFADMAPDLTLGEYLDQNGYSSYFREKFLVPLYAALWSADPLSFESFPARTFALFLGNHGFLRVYGQPQWLVVKGGSSRYLEALTAGWQDRIRLNTPVRALRRTPGGVEVVPRGGEPERFDQAVVAVHSDQALAMLEEPTAAEREVLGAIPYQENSVVLHTDQAMLPKLHKVRASWNYHLPAGPGKQSSVTYSMNRLQGLDAPVEFCVTLNRDDEIDPDSVLHRATYAHPVFTTAGAAAQRRHQEISGAAGIHYCGAYWGFGFHEDGVNSALDVCRQFGERL